MHPTTRNIAGLFGILIVSALLVASCSSLNVGEFCETTLPAAIQSVQAACEGNAACDGLGLTTLDLPGCTEACEVLSQVKDLCARVGQ